MHFYSVSGKVPKKQPASIGKHGTKKSKWDRRNEAKVLLKKRHCDIQANAQFFEGRNGTPKIIVVIPLCPDADANIFTDQIMATEDAEILSDTVWAI